MKQLFDVLIRTKSSWHEMRVRRGDDQQPTEVNGSGVLREYKIT